jgi:hypothetical protein
MASLSSYYPQPVIAGTTAGTYAEGNAPRIIDVTHAELLSLMGGQNLKTGFHYRITDFVTEYMSNDNEWISPSNTANVSNNNGTAFTVASIAATPEPLVVYAYSSSNVSKEAYSNLYSQDIIHYDPSLTYLDGTRTAKGFITYRKDNLRDVSATYDWRNVRFKIWNIDPASGENPIPLWQSGTNYVVGQLLRNTSGQIFQCVANTTTEPNQIASRGSDWRGYLNTNFFYTFEGGIELVGPKSGIPPTGNWGQRNEAKYAATFCRDFSNISLDTSNNIRNVKIECSFPFSSTVTRYSEAIRPHVLMRGNIGSTLIRIYFKNSSSILFQAGGLLNSAFMRDVHVDNCTSVYAAIRTGEAGSSVFLKDCNQFYMPIQVESSRRWIDYSGNNVLSKVQESIFGYSNFNNVRINECKNITTNLGSLASNYNNCQNIVIAHNGSYTNMQLSPFVPIAEKAFRVFGYTPFEAETSVHHYINSQQIPVCEFTNRANSKKIIQYIDSEKLIFLLSNSNILNKISEIESGEVSASLPLFSTKDNDTPTYVRNTSNWLGESVEHLTGYSPWNSAYGSDFGCIAITPRHVWFAKHVTTSLTGATIRFITSDNQVVSKTISRILNSSTTDLAVALLDSDLPESINIIKILQNSSSKKFKPSCTGGVFWINKDKESLITTISNFGITSGITTIIPASSSDLKNKDFYTSEIDGNQRSFYKSVVTGDSGSPLFLLINEEPILAGLVYSAPETPNTEGFELHGLWQNDLSNGGLNTLIANVYAAEGISTGYTVTNFDDSNFADIT